MKKVFLFLISITMLMSCSKEEKKAESEQEKFRIYQETNDGIKDLFALELEWGTPWEDHSVKKVYYPDLAIKNNPYKYVIPHVLTYENDRIIINTPDDLNTYITVYYLENGKINMQKQFTNSDNYKNNNPQATSEYKYNSDGYLSKKGNYEFIYENGNLSAMKWNGITQYQLKYNNKKRVPYSYFITGPFNSDASIALNPYIHNIFEAVLYEKGLFGKTSKDQLAAVKLKDGKENTFIYEYNNGGGINSITKNSYEGNFKFYFQYK